MAIIDTIPLTASGLAGSLAALVSIEFNGRTED